MFPIFDTFGRRGVQRCAVMLCHDADRVYDDRRAGDDDVRRNLRTARVFLWLLK